MRQLALLMLSVVVWAGAASAVSIDLTVIDPPGHVPSATVYRPSDTISVEDRQRLPRATRRQLDGSRLRVSCFGGGGC